MFDKELFNAHRWEDTPLGPRETWSRHLRYMCDFIHRSRQPMFLLWGPERALIYNAAYQDIWNVPALNGMGLPIEEVMSEGWSVLKPLVDRVFAGESFVRTDVPITNAAIGQQRFMDFSYTPLCDFDSGCEDVEGALCISSDVSERHLASQSINESREALALTVSNVTEGVALIDRNFTIVVWNEPFRRHFGYENGRIEIGTNAAELMLETARRGDLGPGDPGVLVAQLVHSIRSTERATLEIQRTNGRVLRLLRQSFSGGHALLVSQDVTEVRTAARLKDELVSTVSHELRTPLTAISGALGIVGAGAAGELSEKAARLIQIAQRNSERLIVLVNDLLDLDKLQSGRISFRFEAVDLAEVVLAGVEQTIPYAERGGQTLRAEVPPHPVPTQIDRHRILQVLSNLISNAVKFSPEGAEVLVRLQVQGRLARISVIDQGIGVPEDFRDRLFQRFAQHESSGTRVAQGTGLGLAICKNIVEHHHGSIWLDKRVQKGATFHVDLPLSEDIE
jgi:signal transduction histidine kinase